MRVLVILPFFISSLLSAQSDSLLLIKKDRVRWCLQQNEKVTILNDILKIKDSAINIQAQRIQIKQDILDSKDRDIITYQAQDSTLRATLKLTVNDKEVYWAEYKKEKKKGIIKNIAIGSLLLIDTLLLFLLISN